MKIKLKNLLIIIFIIFLGTALIFFFIQKNSYRIDCSKPLNGFDVLFVFSEACPHCHADLIRIKELKLLGRFYMVDVNNIKCKEIINKYADFIIYHKNSNFEDIPPGIYTPTKVCLHTNKTYIGEMPKELLKDFYEDCVRVRK